MRKNKIRLKQFHHRLSGMFNIFKNKIQSLLLPNNKRSSSIDVESKRKSDINKKRDASESKSHKNKNDFSPIKILQIDGENDDCNPQTPIKNDKICLENNKPIFTDQLETIEKKMLFAKNYNNFQTAIKAENPKWLDFVSDIGEDKNLLQEQQSEDEMLISSNMSDKQWREKGKKLYESLLNSDNEKKKNGQISFNCVSEQAFNRFPFQSQKFTYDNLDKFAQNLSSQTVNKKCEKPDRLQLKKQLIEEYRKQKKQDPAKKDKQCMVCGNIANPKQTIQLACLHRIHPECAIIMKQKFIFKCNICEKKRYRSQVHENRQQCRNKNDNKDWR